MVTLRRAVPSDAIAYAELQEDEWDQSMVAVISKLEARIETFPEGVLVAEHEGEIVGGASFIRLADYDVDEQGSWEDLTDNGWCSTHVPDGRVMFGVDLSVSRRAPRSTSALMFLGGIELCIRCGVDFGVWGGRMPRYHRYASVYGPLEYATTRNRRGRYLDPEIELYAKIPGVEMLGVVPEYFKDWESLNYGVIFGWSNPVRKFPLLRRFDHQIGQALYRYGRRRQRRSDEARRQALEA